ncbi:MAG: DNA cytosine methyltransferase [Bacteroidota bacterium]
MSPTYIDLFAGAGGLSLGLKLGGLAPLLSIEKDKFAAQTLKRNFNHKICCIDLVEHVKKNDIKKIVKDSPDIIAGGPPCQGFSIAARNRINENDTRNDLPFIFLKWVKFLKPKAFIIENVPGILTKYNSKGEIIFDSIKEYSNSLGYALSVWNLNAANYGVPQSRNRVFLLGMLNGEHIPPPHPKFFDPLSQKENEYNLEKAVTVGEAILDLPAIQAREGTEVMPYSDINEELSDFQEWARQDSKMVYNHVAMNHTPRMVLRYQAFIDGIEDLPDELKVRKRNGNGVLSTSKFNLNYRYLHPDNVSYTIPASFYSSFVHPTIPRNITTREAARLQSFPDTYIFEGKRTLISSKLLKRQGKIDQIGLSQYNQVGNAVPPLLAKVIGQTIRKYL